MNWEKIRPSQYITNPVEIIYARNIVDSPEYDRLYENQNNLSHPVWEAFDKQYRTGFEFKEDITDINFNKEIIALWFFRERSDNNHPPAFDLKGKLIGYMPNQFLITEYKDIQIKESKRKYIRRPLIQLDINREQYKDLINKIK